MAKGKESVGRGRDGGEGRCGCSAGGAGKDLCCCRAGRPPARRESSTTAGSPDRPPDSNRPTHLTLDSFRSSTRVHRPCPAHLPRPCLRTLRPPGQVESSRSVRPRTRALAPFQTRRAHPTTTALGPSTGQFIIDQFEHRDVETGEVIEDHHPEQVWLDRQAALQKQVEAELTPLLPRPSHRTHRLVAAAPMVGLPFRASLPFSSPDGLLLLSKRSSAPGSSSPPPSSAWSSTSAPTSPYRCGPPSSASAKPCGGSDRERVPRANRS